MNKKFSTLVAALLVSGASFAMVSAFDVQPLTASPIAKAATANLRATAVDGYDLGFTATYTDGAKWSASAVTGGFNLRTVDKESYLCQGASNSIIVLPAASATDKITFTVDAKGYLKNGSDFLFMDKVNGTLSQGSAINPQTQYYVGMFSNSTTLEKNTLSTATGDSYFMAAIVEKANDITNSENMVNIATSSTVAFGNGTAIDNASTNKIGGVITAGITDGTLTKVVVVEVAGFNILKATSPKGTEMYITGGDAGGTLTLSYEQPTGNTLSEAVVTAGTSSAVRIGGKALSGNAGTYSLASGTDATPNQEVILVDAKGDVISDFAEGVEGYLVQTTANVSTWNKENIGAGSIVSLNVTAPASFSTVAFDAASAEAKLNVSVNEGKFTLNLKYDYLGEAAAAVEKTAATEFVLDAKEYGAIKDKTGRYLVKNSSAPALSADLTSKTKLYLYKVGTLLPLTDLDGITNADQLFVAEGNFTVAALTEADSKIVTAKENDTPDVPTGEAYKLDNATNYYLSTGGNYLLMSTDKALGNATSEPTSNTAGLWTAAKITNVGQQTYYSFTNLKYGKKLAFKAVYESGNWAVKYDPSGKYNTFFINADGQITFNVKEDANVSTGAAALNATYALDENSTIWGVAVYNAENTDKVTFKPAEETPVAIDKVIELLNTTYGAGNGFGLLFKDKALSADGVKDVALEANPFTDADLITAVQGPATSVTGSADLSAKMFLKVSGSYPLSAAALANVAADKKAEKQLDAFRTSTFIAIDTVRYSSLVPDYDDNNFFKYTTVKGSSMLSKKGYIYDGTTTADNAAFKKGGNFEGITRRIQNAEFSFSQVAGSTMKDPAYFYVATAYIPAANNGAGLAGHTSAVNNQYITIKKFNNKYYVGAGDVATRWDYVYVGLNNDVTYQQVNGIVNIVSRNYTTNGQIYANQNNSKIGLVLPKYVCTDKPEGQFLVQGGNDGAGFTFTNRESGKTLYTSAKGLKTVPGKEDVYAVVGTNDTILIASSEKGALTIGYQVYDQDKDLNNKIYNLRLQTNVPGMPKAYVTEKDHDATHAMGLDADSLNAATFKLVKFAAAKDDDKMYGDSLFVSYEREYSYVKVKDGVKSYDVKKDTVVAFTYAIYNADNKEYVAYNDKGANKFYYCNPDLKYNGTANYAAQKFIIKQKENGTYHLLPVDADFTAAEDESPIKLNTNSQDKLYGGFAEEGGKIDQREDIYETTYNDLFEIVEVGAPMYRTVEAAPFDTLRIYKEGMDNVALFAETAKPEIVSGENFLGMTHQADKDLNKTMFSLFVDTAYVNRADNYKPQYMLVLDADTVHGTYSCNIPSHGLHDNGRIDTVYGKYLINMKDSAEVWDAAKKHNNPYWWERNVYPRLAFVNAKHVGDNLIILNDNGIQSKNDTINLSDNSDKFGVYAFRIADREAKSFLIETAYNRKADGSFDATGWIKWLNGIPVVVSDMEQAEVFNFEATAKNPTANDAISTTSLSVVATDGAVIIKGAAGKTVAISNILGQTIANTVLSSDNETIAAPAGVVVVAVEGEAAVKAIVK